MKRYLLQVSLFVGGIAVLLSFLAADVKAASLESSTATAILPSSHWIWPLTPQLTDELHSLMDQVVAGALQRYGSNQAKVVFLENSTALLNDFAVKAKAAFPNAVIVGAGPGNENYNAFVTQDFAEHGERSLALLALGGSDVTRVQASGQKNVGQGSDAALQFQAGAQIAQDLKPHLDPSKRNLIYFFGPGHTPNHRQILCGFKQGMAGLTNLCDASRPDNPELPGLPPLPSHVHIIGTGSYYTGNTVLDTTVTSRTALGILIQGNFRLALTGFAGTPTATNITAPINTLNQELGVTPTHVFLSPGHPVVGEYELLRQKMVTLMPSATIFGHEGGGEIGHAQTSLGATAVTNTLFMAAMAPSSSGSGTTRVNGDMDNDRDVDIYDYSAFVNKFGTTDSTADFNRSGYVDIYDYNALISNFGVRP